jgi:ribosome-associated protein
MPAREADAPYDDDGRPSKSQLKREAHDLQHLGEELAALSDAVLETLPMDDGLRGALQELRRTRSHEGRRRQLQYVGKLMRQGDPEPLREAVARAKLGGARDSLRLHTAERWREDLVADDDAVTRWADEVPDSDLQRLRNLVRNARIERKPDGPPGQAPRQSRAWRELFQFIQHHLPA